MVCSYGRQSPTIDHRGASCGWPAFSFICQLPNPHARSKLHAKSAEIWYNVWVAGEEALTIKKPQTVSLIDTISEGFIAVNRRPWLILLPILVNLYVWFGSQLSFAPLLTDLATIMRMS